MKKFTKEELNLIEKLKEYHWSIYKDHFEKFLRVKKENTHTIVKNEIFREPSKMNLSFWIYPEKEESHLKILKKLYDVIVDYTKELRTLINSKELADNDETFTIIDEPKELLEEENERLRKEIKELSENLKFNGESIAYIYSQYEKYKESMKITVDSYEKLGYLGGFGDIEHLEEKLKKHREILLGNLVKSERDAKEYQSLMEILFDFFTLKAEERIENGETDEL